MAPKAPQLPQFRPTQTPPGSIEDLCTESISGSTCIDEDTDSQPERRNLVCRSRWVSPIEFFFDWTLKVLGVASAVLFGLWAPVSYNAQMDGNKSNDDAQAKLSDKVDRLGEEMEGLKMRVEGLGALRAWEFCDGDGKSTLSACQALSSTLQINSLINDLRSFDPKHKPSSRRTPTAFAPGTISTATPSISIPTVQESSASLSASSPLTYTPSPPSIPLPTETGMKTVPGLPRPGLGLGGEMAGPEKMAVMLGLAFVILFVLAVVGGWRVVKCNGRRKDQGYVGLGEKMG